MVSMTFVYSKSNRNFSSIGILKEGDFLIQAGAYDLSDVDIPTALLLIERAYEEGKKVLKKLLDISKKISFYFGKRFFFR